MPIRWYTARAKLVAMLIAGGFGVGACERETAEVFEAPPAAPASTPSREAVPLEAGEVTVDTFWTANDVAQFRVNYRNTSSSTFTNLVTVRCTAISPGGTPVATNQRSFFARERGTITPGFSDTLAISVELNDSTASRADCTVAAAR